MPWNSFLPSNPLTMKGMLEKSNHVLEHAAKMDRNGSLSILFQQAKGIVLISVVESAIGITGAVGSGICMAKDEQTGLWSPPCACGMATQGYGIAVGAMVKDIIIFAFDDKSVQNFASKMGLKMNVGTSVTLGTYGINAGANLNVSRRGAEGSANISNYSIGGTVSIAFSKGAFAAAAASASVVGPRDYVNHNFYDNKQLSAQQILFEGTELLNSIEHKKQDVELIQQLYQKLDLLTKGETNDIVPEIELENLPNEAPTYIDNIAAAVTKQLEEGVKDPQVLNEDILVQN